MSLEVESVILFSATCSLLINYTEHTHSEHKGEREREKPQGKVFLCHSRLKGTSNICAHGGEIHWRQRKEFRDRAALSHPPFEISPADLS